MNRLSQLIIIAVKSQLIIIAVKFLNLKKYKFISESFFKNINNVLFL